MLCNVCGNVDVISTSNLTIQSFENGLPLNMKNIKVCPSCQGWLIGTRKNNGTSIDIEEGKPIKLYEVKSYEWGTQPPKIKKQAKTLNDYIEKTNKKHLKE